MTSASLSGHVVKMSYELSITVDGRGLDPNNRSHWAFMICEEGKDYGERLQVALLDRATLRYMFEMRSTVVLRSAQGEGRCVITSWNAQQRQKAMELIRAEEAPCDGKRRCQDWVLEVLIGLEAEALIPAGTSSRWEGLVGKPAAELAAELGPLWEAFKV